jgi:hypothetical protein
LNSISGLRILGSFVTAACKNRFRRFSCSRYFNARLLQYHDISPLLQPVIRPASVHASKVLKWPFPV